MNAKNLFDGPILQVSAPDCQLDGALYDKVPMLLDETGEVQWDVTAWFRSLVVKNIKPPTVYQYATSLCVYWNYLFLNTLDWQRPSDAILRVWRNGLRDKRSPGKPLAYATVNAHLECVINFYQWAQEHQRCGTVIGVTPQNKKPLPIRLVRRFYRKRIRLTSDLLYRIPRKPRKAIPTRREYEELLEVLGGPSPINVRNCLMCKWLVGSGLRRFELMGLTTLDLPDLGTCLKLKDEGRLFWLRITGKNGTIRDVPVLPDVLIETHDFIDVERHEMLSDLRRYSETAIFISSSSGGAMNLQAFSHAITKAFRSFTTRRLTVHRLRARFASLLVKSLREEEVARVGLAGLRDETILERAAVILGHADTNTLRFYLNIDLDTEDLAATIAIRSALAMPISTDEKMDVDSWLIAH